MGLQRQVSSPMSKDDGVEVRRDFVVADFNHSSKLKSSQCTISNKSDNFDK